MVYSPFISFLFVYVVLFTLFLVYGLLAFYLVMFLFFFPVDTPSVFNCRDHSIWILRTHSPPPGDNVFCSRIVAFFCLKGLRRYIRALGYLLPPLFRDEGPGELLTAEDLMTLVFCRDDLTLLLLLPLGSRRTTRRSDIVEFLNSHLRCIRVRICLFERKFAKSPRLFFVFGYGFVE